MNGSRLDAVTFTVYVSIAESKTSGSWKETIPSLEELRTGGTTSDAKNGAMFGRVLFASSKVMSAMCYGSFVKKSPHISPLKGATKIL